MSDWNDPHVRHIWQPEATDDAPPNLWYRFRRWWRGEPPSVDRLLSDDGTYHPHNKTFNPPDPE